MVKQNEQGTRCVHTHQFGKQFQTKRDWTFYFPDSETHVSVCSVIVTDSESFHFWNPLLHSKREAFFLHETQESTSLTFQEMFRYALLSATRDSNNTDDHT
jgi:hypothetical protein